MKHIVLIIIVGIFLAGCSRKTAEQLKQECYQNSYTYGGFDQNTENGKLTAKTLYEVCLERNGID